MTTIAEHRAKTAAVKYNHDLQVVEWGLDVEGHYYTRQSVKYLIGFLCWRVDEKEFYLTVNSREFKVKITGDQWGHTAKTSDGIEVWSSMSREEALEGLIEKLQMAIEEGRI